MADFLLAVQVLVALVLIGVVLLQQGKGADMGASFGGGSSQTLFGARGSATFLSRVTAILVTILFATSLSLTYLSTHHGAPARVTETAPPAHSTAPAVPPTVPAVPSTGAPGKNMAPPQPPAGASSLPAIPGAPASTTKGP